MKYILMFIAAAFVIYAAAENLFFLRIRREKLGSGIKIAHISDLHHRRFGKNNARLLKSIRREAPDIILISGDLVSRDCTDFSEARALLTELGKIAPVYMANGNHETDLLPQYYAEFERSVRDADAVLLRNGSLLVPIKGRKLNIFGFEAESTVYKKDGSYRGLDEVTIKEMNEKLGKASDGEVLLIAHNPLFAEIYADWGANYTFSGHLHGGAAKIPFTDIGLLSPERRLFPKYSKGIYTVGDMKLLVSGGLGKLRLFNPPEVVIYEI